MSKNMVCIKRSAPKSPDYECEYLDLVTALASFDYHIDLVFQDEGSRSLLVADQESIHSKRLQSLPLFDVHDIWVDEESLKVRQLSSASLSIAAKPLSKAELNILVERSKWIYVL